jgi:hypothetical protein
VYRDGGARNGIDILIYLQLTGTVVTHELP